MKHGTSKGNHGHPLVSIVKDPLTGIRCVLRFKEPLTGRVTTRKLSGLNARQMTLAAKEKSRALLNIRERLLTGEYLPNEHDVDVIQDWIDEVGIAQATKRNRNAIGPILRYAEENIINGRLTTVSRKHLVEIKDLFMKRGNKRTTLNLRLSQLKSLLRSLAGKGSLTSGVSTDAINWELKPVKSRLQKDQTKSAPVLTAPQLQDIFKASVALDNPHYSAILACLFLTGARKMELTSIKDSKVQENAGQIPHITLFASKTGRSRDISLLESPMLIHLIDALQTKQLPGNGLFNFTNSSLQHFCSKIGSSAGFSFSPKQLRATCGSFLVKIGTPESLISRRLGHTERQSLISYRNGAEILLASDPEAKTLESATGLTDHFHQIYCQLMGLNVSVQHTRTQESVTPNNRLSQIISEAKKSALANPSSKITEELAARNVILVVKDDDLDPLDLPPLREMKLRRNINAHSVTLEQKEKLRIANIDSYNPEEK